MRVLMLSKSLVVSQYRTKAEAIASRPGVDLTVVVPPLWRDERGELRLEPGEAEGYKLIVAPIWLNGRYHAHFYPTIGGLLKEHSPDLVHIDEEPYNLATFHALWEMRRRLPRARALFFTWQNIPRVYPPPFSWTERYVLDHSALALAGNRTAVDVLRRKGFNAPIRVIPQFGVDPSTFAPSPRIPNDKMVVGFAGRFVPEKGIQLLIRALATIACDWELRILGSGPERPYLLSVADALGLSRRVQIQPWRSSAAMPDFYCGLDLLVVPSITRPNWTEQFGRVLIEAMACGVPVVGSDSGEIPNVIGDAGVVVPEGNVEALSQALRALCDDPGKRAELGRRGRARVLEHYTQEQIAQATVEAYAQALA